MEEPNSVISGSWVELDVNIDESCNLSVNSSCNDDLEHLLREAQKEGSTPSLSLKSSSRCVSLNSSSPIVVSYTNSSKSTPQVISGSNSPCESKTTQLEEALPRLMRQTNNTDWVWDWSSQPTITPPNESKFRHPKVKRTPLSLRNTEIMKYNFFSWEFLKFFIPSIVVTHILAFGIGCDNQPPAAPFGLLLFFINKIDIIIFIYFKIRTYGYWFCLGRNSSKIARIN